MGSGEDINEASRQHFRDRAAEYERASGGSTSSIAARLVDLSGPFDEHSHVLDLAAGPGVVIDELLKCDKTKQGARNASYTVVEPAESMMEIVHYKMPSTWSIPRDHIVTHQLPAEALDDEKLFPNERFTHIFCNFGFMFFPEPERAAKNIYRTLSADGRASISTFTHVGYWSAVARASEIIIGGRSRFEPPFPMAWTKGEHLADVLRSGGLEIVVSSVEECQMTLPSVQELAKNTARRFSGIFRKQGWTDEELGRLASALEVELAADVDNVKIKEDCVEVKMVANVVVCSKGQGAPDV